MHVSGVHVWGHMCEHACACMGYVCVQVCEMCVRALQAWDVCMCMGVGCVRVRAWVG